MKLNLAWTRQRARVLQLTDRSVLSLYVNKWSELFELSIDGLDGWLERRAQEKPCLVQYSPLHESERICHHWRIVVVAAIPFCACVGNASVDGWLRRRRKFILTLLARQISARKYTVRRNNEWQRMPFVILRAAWISASANSIEWGRRDLHAAHLNHLHADFILLRNTLRVNFYRTAQRDLLAVECLPVSAQSVFQRALDRCEVLLYA